MVSENPQLNRAIQLVRAGYTAEALSILVEIVRADAHNEIAWAWLIQALPKGKRTEATEIFLRQNPDSVIARKALEAAQGDALAAVQAPAPEAVQRPPAPFSAPAAELLYAPLDFVEEASPTLDQPAASTAGAQGSFIEEEQDRVGSNPAEAEEGISPEDIRRSVTSWPPAQPVRKVRPAKGRPMTWMAMLTGVVVILLVISVALVLWWVITGGTAPSSTASLTQTAATGDVAAAKTLHAQPTATTIVIILIPTEVLPTPSNGVTPTPTVYLSTPQNAAVIVPENVSGIKLAAQSQESLYKVVVSPSLRFLVPLDGSAKVNLLDFNSRLPVFSANLPSDSMSTAAFAPDEGCLAASINMGDVLVYEIPSGKVLSTLATGEVVMDDSASLVFSSDSRSLAAVSGNAYILWDMADGTVTGQGTLPDGPLQFGQKVIGPVSVVGQTLYTSCGLDVCAIDATSGSELQRFSGIHNGPASRFVIARNGEQVAVQTEAVGGAFTVTLYNAQTGSVQTVLETSLTEIWGLAFSPDDRLLTAWGAHGAGGKYALVFLDAQKLATILTLDVGNIPSQVPYLHRFALSYSPDGRMLMGFLPPGVMVFAVQ
jgi:hypothetical protein